MSWLKSRSNISLAQSVSANSFHTRSSPTKGCAGGSRGAGRRNTAADTNSTTAGGKWGGDRRCEASQRFSKHVVGPNAGYFSCKLEHNSLVFTPYITFALYPREILACFVLLRLYFINEEKNVSHPCNAPLNLGNSTVSHCSCMLSSLSLYFTTPFSISLRSRVISFGCAISSLQDDNQIIN